MHIVFLNPQGNFDRYDSYWTEHPDFGGQLVYVKELACAMGKLGCKVDIITRQIIDKNWPEFSDKFDFYEDIENVRIIRLPAGPDVFLPKELLWEHLYEWVDNIMDFYKEEGGLPDFITTHYGDGGISGAMLYERTNIPFSFTGHSLGAQKMDKLGVNLKNIDEMESRYNFTKRIMAERIAMANSSLIFVSTAQERDEQYTHKAYIGAGHLNNMQKFHVVPPGVNTQVFSPNILDQEDHLAMKKLIDHMIRRDIEKSRQNLPAIVAASRLDPKKNHVGLVKAFGESLKLQEKANLIITLRGIENPFEDYSFVKKEEMEILDEIMELIDTYNLRGKVCMFSIGSQRELADCYRELANRNSVFCLTSVYEPFGLAPIEAMSCGLPVAVTKYGGPKEVLKDKDGEYGVLIDPFDEMDTASGILNLFSNYEYYKRQGIERVKSKYTWEATAKTYLEAIQKAVATKKDYHILPIHPYFISPDELDKIELDWLKKIYLRRD
ncbi:MAG: glycosyltransferase [Caldicoprobacterales bacterium]